MLGVVIPFSLLLFRKIRTSQKGLFYTSILVILGFVANRMNTAVTSMEHWPQRTYFPSWQELSITVALATGGFVAFYYIAKYFPVFGHHNNHLPAQPVDQEWLKEVEFASKER
jgi:Ni/Fe-hydrogenase subunit HybB-like protein